MHLIAHLGRGECTQPRLHLLRRASEDETCRKCRKCIADIVPSRQRYAVVMPLVAPRHHELRAARRKTQCLGTDIRICADAIGENAHAVCRHRTHRSDAFIVRVEEHGSAHRDRLYEFCLCLCNIFDGTEQLHMHLADIRHNADIRRSNGCERGDLSQPAHADLHDGGGIILRDAEQCQRQSDLVVIVRRRAADRAAPREDGCRQVLRRGLAVRARDCNDGDVELHAPRMRDLLVGLQCIRHYEDCPLFLLQILLHGGRQRRIDEDCRSALVKRIRGKICTIKILPAQGNEEVTCRDLPRIRRDMGDRIIPTQFSAVYLGIRCRKHLIPCHRHITAPRSLRAPSRGHRSELFCPLRFGSFHVPCRE